MATIGDSVIGLADIARREGGAKGEKSADFIMMLAQTNGMLLDAIARQCNKGSAHYHKVMTGLPDVTWGRLYKGTPSSKSRHAMVTDVTGFIEGRVRTDERLKKVEGEDVLPMVRLQEGYGHIEAISQEHQRALLYEDVKDSPDRITGLAPRFNSGVAENGSQLVDAGGTGSDNTSIWFVTWGMDACHLIYPEGADAPLGVEHQDHGIQSVDDENNDRYFAYEDTYRLYSGLCVRDWRKIVRIANIDISDLRAGSVDLYKFMRRAYYRVHGLRSLDNGLPNGDKHMGNFKMGKTCIYANRDVLEALDALATNAGAGDNFTRLKPREIEGQEILTYRGMPVRQVDQLVNTEARIADIPAV